MIVRMHDSGRGVTSLRIGARNVRRYFTKGMPTIDLDLDSVLIQCDLSQDFWQDHPEIADPRLCAWLTAKKTKLKVDGDSAVLLMLPAGKNAFRLQTRRQRGIVSPVLPAIQPRDSANAYQDRNTLLQESQFSMHPESRVLNY
jgi:hypothetical protein